MTTDPSANVRQLFDLAGRVAIITGGSIGLGRQMATALAEMGKQVRAAPAAMGYFHRPVGCGRRARGA